MTRMIHIVFIFLIFLPIYLLCSSPFDTKPDWESSDERSTECVVFQDFNGDGWQFIKGEVKTGDGHAKIFYIKHFPALTIKEIRINGTKVQRSDYCFDENAGWISFKNAPTNGAKIEVDYIWSNNLDLFAGNYKKEQTDGIDVIYFNIGGQLNPDPGWFSDDNENSYYAAAADFDNDGDIDLAEIDGDYIKLYKNSGHGLETKPSWEFYEPKSAFICLAWGDLNNDDYLELAVADFDNYNHFYVFKNNNGELENTPSWIVDYYMAFDVAWGDMDGDGDMDLAGSTYDSGIYDNGYAYIFRNNNGDLEKTPCWKNEGLSGNCKGLAWGDVNGDGEMDLIKGICGAGPNHDRYTDIFYSKDGILPTTTSWESTYYEFVMNSILADCDCDGLLDLVQSIGSGCCGYFHNGKDLEAYPSWKYFQGYNYSNPSITIGDINNDGLFDIALASDGVSDYPKGGHNLVFLNKHNIGIDLTSFTAKPHNDAITLNWTISTDEDILGFNLYRRIIAPFTVSTVRENSYSPTCSPAILWENATFPLQKGDNTQWTKVNTSLITGTNPYSFTDKDIMPDTNYEYKLEAVVSERNETLGTTEYTSGRGTPSSFDIVRIYPTPAYDRINIDVVIPEQVDIDIAIYDITGRKVAIVASGLYNTGEYILTSDITGLTDGVYIVKMTSEGLCASKRFVVAK